MEKVKRFDQASKLKEVDKFSEYVVSERLLPETARRFIEVLDKLDKKFFDDEGNVKVNMPDSTIRAMLKALDDAQTSIDDVYINPENYIDISKFISSESDSTDEATKMAAMQSVLEGVVQDLLSEAEVRRIALEDYMKNKQSGIAQEKNATETAKVEDGAAGKPDVRKKDEFDRGLYIDGGLEDDFMGSGYRDIRALATIFRPNEVIIDETRLAELALSAGGLERVGEKVDNLIKRVNRDKYLVSTEKQGIITDIVVVALERLRDEVLSRHTALQKENDKSAYTAWESGVSENPVFEALSKSVLSAIGFSDFNSGVEKYNEIKSKTVSVERAIAGEKAKVPASKQADVEDYINTEYLQKANDALERIKNKLLPLWRNNLAETHEEFGELVAQARELTKILTLTSSEIMNIYKRVKPLLERIRNNNSKEKPPYVLGLPDELVADAKEQIKGIMSRFDVIRAEATKKMQREVDLTPEVVELVKAAREGETAKTNSADIQKQVDAIVEARKKLISSDIVGRFDSDLQIEVEARIKPVVEDAGKTLESLRNEMKSVKNNEDERDKGKTVIEKKKELKDVITYVLDQRPIDEWVRREDKKAIEGYQTKLRQLQIDARKLGVTLLEQKEQADFDAAEKACVEAIALAEKMTAEYRENVWAAIMKKTDATPQDMSDAQDKILASCDLVDLANKSREIKYWEGVFKITKAFIRGSAGDAGARRRLAWQNAKRSRENIAALAGDGVTTEFFREYYHGAENDRQRAVVDRIRDLYSKGYAYRDSSGVEKIWSFAQKGEPTEKDKKNGAKTMDEVLRGEFDPKLYPKSLIDSAIYFSIDIELRMPYLSGWYRNYLVSPDFDVSPITDVDPEAAAYYDIRKTGSVDPSKLFWLKVIAAPTEPITENSPLINPPGYEYTDIGSRKKTVGNEYQPRPAPPDPEKPGDYIKNDINTSVGNDSIEDAYELAVMTDISLTSAYRIAFKPVKLRSGRRNLIPYYSEGIISAKTYGIEYDKNSENLGAWSDFLKFVQNPPKLSAEYGARSALVDAGNALSKAKEIFSYIDATGDKMRQEDFTDVVTEILKRYTKNIFNQFHAITEGDSPVQAIKNAWAGKEIVKSDQFLKEALQAFDGLKTLPGSLNIKVQSEIIRLAKDGDNGFIIGRSGFFSPSTNNPARVVGAGLLGDRAERVRREKILAIFHQKQQERIPATDEKHK